MSSIREWVGNLGGYARKRELVALGARDRDLTYAVRSGSVERVRNGWYSTAPPTDPAFRAMRVGGRLTGASALRAAGAWMRDGAALHVSLPGNSARIRSQWNRWTKLTATEKHGAIVHWDGPAVVGRGTRTAVDVVDALLNFVEDAPFEEAVAVLDWATHSGRIDLIEFERLVLRMPRRLRGIRNWVDPHCGGYPESIARTRLRMRGYRVTSQVPVGDLESIDLLVEDEVALEVDGEEHHRDRFERDRRKDLSITIEHRHALRITVSMLMNDWNRVIAGIDAALEDRGRRRRWKLRNRAPTASESTRTPRIGRRGMLRLPEFATSGG